MEPSAIRRRLRTQRNAARGVEVAVAASPRTVQGIVVGAGLAAAATGLLGVDGGLVLLVVGVWLVRSVWGRPPGLAWGIACVASGLRWGTLGLGDVEAATRTLGPALAVGPRAAVLGSGLALLAAVVDEAARGDVWASGAERVAGAAALVALVPAFCAPGPRDLGLGVTLVWWAGAAAALGTVMVAARRPARLLPSWVAPAVAAAGAIAVGVSVR